jgi:hypothetical protein
MTNGFFAYIRLHRNLPEIDYYQKSLTLLKHGNNLPANL